MTDGDARARAEQILGHSFQDPDLLVISLTHSSIAQTRTSSNERLEFLGDAILGLVICDELYRRFPDWLEGELTRVKSIVVSRKVCAQISDDTGLTDLLILGNGLGRREHMPTSLRAAVYESVIGALFLDGGLEPAKRFILDTAKSFLDECADAQNVHNYKSALQQYAQRRLSTTPHYESLDEQGPDHSKCFEVCVVLDGERFPGAWGPSKKEAEQEAAKRALEILQERDGRQSRSSTD